VTATAIRVHADDILNMQFDTASTGRIGMSTVSTHIVIFLGAGGWSFALFS